MSSATPEQRALWRKLDEERTHGEWEAKEWYGSDEGGWAAVGPHHEGEENGEWFDDNPDGELHQKAKRDSAFVRASTIAIPALLDLADAQDAEIARLRAEVERLGAVAPRGREILALCKLDAPAGPARDYIGRLAVVALDRMNRALSQTDGEADAEKEPSHGG